MIRLMDPRFVAAFLAGTGVLLGATSLASGGVLVGGVALNVHGIVRATEDIDLFVRAEDANVERLKDALREIWNDPSIEEISAEDLAGDYPTIRYGPPGESFVVDLLSRLGEAFDYDDLEAELVVLDGVTVRVATPRTLYEMKKEVTRGWNTSATTQCCTLNRRNRDLIDFSNRLDHPRAQC